MTATPATPATIDDYIATFPDDVRPLLHGVRGAIRAALPGAEERIRYGMPAVMLSERSAIHFAAWKKHIGLYPVSVLPGDLEAEVARLRGTVVLLMAVHNVPAIAARLVSSGRDAATPVAVVADGSMPTQRTVWSTLADIAADLEREQVRPPAIVVIGEVVAVDDKADLTAYAKVDGQAGCCSPAASSSTLPMAGATTTVHEDLAKLLERFDVNQYAGSFKFYAIR